MSDYSRQDILDNVSLEDIEPFDGKLEELPEKVIECEKSIKEDQPSLTKSERIAICRDQLDMADSDCPEGKVLVNGRCVPKESTGELPGTLSMSEPKVYSLSDLETEPIERLEEGDSIRYTSVRLLGPGVWTDSKSRDTIWYSPDGISNLSIKSDNTLNMMHDENNSVSDIGHIDPDSVETDDKGYLYGDLVLHMENSASEYADENLKATLESSGAKGFGGPSVEITNTADDVEYNSEKGMQELRGGTLTGAALVSNPASKNVAFSTQTAQRGVALSDGEQTTMVLEEERSAMTTQKILERVDVTELADAEEVQDDAQNIADELDVPIGEVMEVLDPLLDMDDEEDGGDEPEEGEEMQEDEDEPPEENEGEDEDEEEEMDMETKVQSLEERLTNLEDMMEQAMAAEDVKEELEAFEQDLADAESVKELEEAKEDLEKRLSELEDEPENPRSLSDGATEEESEEPGTVTMARSYDSRSGTISR